MSVVRHVGIGYPTALLRILIANKQYVEPDVMDLFVTVGLKKVKSVGLYPGLNNDEMVGLGDILSLPLDVVPDAPLQWFSHFITIFEKSPNS